MSFSFFVCFGRENAIGSDSIPLHSIACDLVPLFFLPFVCSDEFSEALRCGFEEITEMGLKQLDATYGEDGEGSVPLAKLLPPIASFGSSLLENADDNSFVQVVGALPQLHVFCSRVYSSAIGSGGKIARAM